MLCHGCFPRGNSTWHNSAKNFLLLQHDLKTSIEQAYLQCTESKASSLRNQEGFLWHQDKIFVPQQTRLQVLKTFHDHQLSGHFGVRKTTELIQQCFWKPTLNWIVGGMWIPVPSVSVIRGPTPRLGVYWPLLVPEQPWKRISIDFIVDLPPTEGYTTIFVVVDSLSKMAHFLPMIDTPSSVDTVNIFIKEIFRLHSLPDSIVSDRGV